MADLQVHIEKVSNCANLGGSKQICFKVCVVDLKPCHHCVLSVIAFTQILKQHGVYSQTRSMLSFWAYIRILQGAISMILEMLEELKWIMVMAKKVTPSHLHLHLTLFLIISMGNSHLLSPLVGRSLLLPMTVSSTAYAAFTSLHLNPGGYISGTFVLAQGGSHPHGFSALTSGETNGHQHPLFSIALPCIQHNMVIVLLRFPSDQSSSRYLISSTMYCSTPCMMSMYLVISQ